MKSRIKHITAVIVLISMFMNVVAPFQAYGEIDSVQFDGTQSAWAEPEIKEAYGLSLTYSNVMSSFNKNITREEFCTLVIKLYEKLTGVVPVAADNIFKDTDNKEILKAYKLGIVKGTAADMFSPSAYITRQEICVMIYRSLTVSVLNLDKDTSGNFPFKDASKIATWASDAMKFAYKNEIMKGVSSDTIDPLSNTTREQAIVLLLRTYKKYSTAAASQEAGKKGTVTVVEGPAPIKDFQKKYEFTMVSNNVFFPKFDERTELFVSTQSGKPSKLPVFSSDRKAIKYSEIYAALSNPVIVPNIPQMPEIPDLNTPVINPPKIELPDLPVIYYQPPIKERAKGPVYTKSDFGAFVDKNGDNVRWFSFKLNNAPGAAKVVWQVSAVQFSGYKSDFKTQPGIVMTGEAAVSSKEFSVDFAKVYLESLKLVRNPIPQTQKTFYVRAVAVDTSGNPIGDPGKGIAVLFGEKVISKIQNTQSAFELWTPKSCLGSSQAETVDEPVHDPWSNGNNVSVDPTSTTTRLFQLNNLDEDASRVIVQVYDEDFDDEQTYVDKNNLVYEKEYKKTELYSGNYTPSVLVPFKEFGKDPAQMAAEQYIEYNVRIVAIADDEQPGREKTIYSDIVKVQYGFGKPVTIIAPPVPPSKYDKTVVIDYSIPSVRITGYKSIDWADPEYLSHYYVFREPEPHEIFNKWKYGGETLSPNIKALMYPNGSYPEYEAAIHRVIPEGRNVYIPKPQEKDKPWYEELYDGVVGFFVDLVSTLAKIYADIQQKYESIKKKLIETVVSVFPIKAFREYLAVALEGLINYGLMSVGIPPTLPNFEKLAEDNIAYLTQVALTEAGIPPNEITDEITKKTASGIVDEFKNANNKKDENPVNAPFLKLNPDYLYNPAYVEIEVRNDTDYPSVPGTLDLNVQFRLDRNGIYATSYDPTGLFLTNDTNKYNYDPNLGTITSTEYRNHFIYGLNGYTVDYLTGGIIDGVAIYEVFMPVVDLKIPVVQPHSSINLKVYVEPGGFALTSRYPEAESPRYEDFYNMYKNNGGGEYTWFQIETDYPSGAGYLRSQAQKEGRLIFLDPKTEYVYHYEDSFNGYGRLMKMPVNKDW
ncbi:S-layer homology domain-containing protein [Sedimentibacter saalensis]|uniref:S-layer homology domain-containing protein n=1 Tax=Sedimentibacter saalensis TaxID=130788 RepID=UPI00289C3FC5|nr:S-layer homology domain-containing protein [Sedimentibacter saalensis]